MNSVAARTALADVWGEGKAIEATGRGALAARGLQRTCTAEQGEMVLP